MVVEVIAKELYACLRSCCLWLTWTWWQWLRKI